MYGRKQIFWLLLLIILLVAGYLVFSAETPHKPFVSLTDAFITPSVPHYVDYYQRNKELIDCLIKYESSGNPDAIGDNGTSFGILQFKKSTFKSYCVERYGYQDDLMNPEIQRLCAGEMIWQGGINHWSVAPRCI